MKIIGFVYNDGKAEMVLKCDSCLLNGRKPFFVPAEAQEIGVTECLVLRVSRLGKGIARKFAGRYYDAVAPGADFVDLSRLRQVQAEGKPWTKAIAFDYSLALGTFSDERLAISGDYVLSPEEAIEEASREITIRQGDLIYIQRRQVPRSVQKEEVIRVEMDGEEKLYCKIK